jgi:flagellar hook protein FlgE
MTISSSSFYTSLSGLNAAQTDLATTSNNIANAQSTGFKSTRAEFSDVIASSTQQAGSSTIGQGTRLQSLQQNFSQGSAETTGRSLDLMVNNSGFFVTKASASSTGLNYTRNGAFSLDGANNVVDASGGALQVLPVDSQGNVTSSTLQSLNVPATNGSAKATSEIDLTLNFPSDADLPASRSAYATAGYSFSPKDSNSYNSATSTTVYDSAGNALPATVYYVRTSAPSADGSSTTSSWDAHTFLGDQELTPATTLTFDAKGALTSPSGAVSYAAAQPTGAASPLTVSVDYGTATKQGSYAFSTVAISQDGNTIGKISGVDVNKNGIVSATYSNGQTVALGAVALANFTNPEGLKQIGNATWTATLDSGTPQIGAASTDGLGTITAGSLEQSNVDLTSELVQLIAAQRNFQANSKAIDTDKQMFQSIFQIN